MQWLILKINKKVTINAEQKLNINNFETYPKINLNLCVYIVRFNAIAAGIKFLIRLQECAK